MRINRILLRSGLLSFLAGVLSVVLSAGCTAWRQIHVSNPSGFDRMGEMVEVPVEGLGLPAGGAFLLQDGKDDTVPFQWTYDGKLIFQTDVPAGGKAVYRLVRAKAGAPAPVFDTVACGSHRDDRLDDIAWENDRTAFRAFGPRLQASGARSFGYDVFTKSVRYPVVDERYRLQPLGKSIHVDNGNGMDVYEVGPTLGCGTSALLHGGEIVYPWCYKDYEILDNGPLRFTVRLTYGPETVGSDTAVVETRLLSLDAGSCLNKVVVRYDGLSAPSTAAAGIVIHKENPDEGFVDAGEGILAYPDLGGSADRRHGLIFCGVLRPGGFDRAAYVTLNPDGSPISDGATGHLLGSCAYAPGSEFTYWFGSGWTKALPAEKGGNTPVKDFEAWKAVLRDAARRIAQPLTVEVK
ncbi:MAG: DUF4861 domain-containing protein [Bacteroidales bacterium]|nr:DUF4861 domain-containing protein [Bacteroidales bacterium]